MVILRCTKKLLHRIGTSIGAADEGARSTTRLGDWTANIVTFDRRKVVLAVSHETLLPVIFPLPPAKELEQRFRGAVYEMLYVLDIGHAKIDPEVMALTRLAVAPTTDRRVLGIAVEYAREMNGFFDSALLDLAFNLADRPMRWRGKLSSPRDATRDLFSRPFLRLVSG